MTASAPARPSPAEAPGARSAERVPDPVRLVEALEAGLHLAMVRRGETYHLRTCLVAGVNSKVYPCSEKCVETQRTLARSAYWRARQAVTVQQSMFESEVAG